MIETFFYFLGGCGWMVQNKHSKLKFWTLDDHFDFRLGLSLRCRTFVIYIFYIVGFVVQSQLHNVEFQAGSQNCPDRDWR